MWWCQVSAYLVAVHLVAMFQGKDLAQGDADGIANYCYGKGVAHHPCKVVNPGGHRGVQPAAKREKQSWKGAFPQLAWPGCCASPCSIPGDAEEQHEPNLPLTHPLGMSPTMEIPYLFVRSAP